MRTALYLRVSTIHQKPDLQADSLRLYPQISLASLKARGNWITIPRCRLLLGSGCFYVDIGRWADDCGLGACGVERAKGGALQCQRASGQALCKSTAEKPFGCIE
jgi:hypothetical protein